MKQHHQDRRQLFFYTIKINTTNHHVQASSTWDLVKEKAVEGKECATEKVTLSKEKLVEFFFVIPQITLCSVQASNRDLVKEKGVEGKEAATVSVTSLKEAAVEKVPTCRAQRVPEPDPIPGISFDTRPDPIQF